MLATTRTVIVDEIHASRRNKRGSHLALSLERLDGARAAAAAAHRPVGDAEADRGGGALPGRRARRARVLRHRRRRATAASSTWRIEVPPSPLEAVCRTSCGSEVYERLAELVEQHRTTLVFVNTRRWPSASRTQLTELLGEDSVAAHHGSLAKERRLDAEQRLKRGELKALVATASLELGIDIGDVDLVCQLGSPRSIATLPAARRPLRPRRRRHAQGPAVPADARRAGRMRRAARRASAAASWTALAIPRQPLDVLAQQIVAEVAAQEWSEDELFALHAARLAVPRRSTREDFDAVVAMLADGFSTRRGRRGALHPSRRGQRRLRGRRGARLTAITSGGTIPDNADYQVLLEPENHVIGTRQRGLRRREPRRRRLPARQPSLPDPARRARRGARRGRAGQPPTIPFWLGEAPGRTDELSASVSRLRADVARRLQARSDRRTAAALADRRARHRRAGRASSSSTISPPATARSAACRRRRRSCSSASSTRPAACSWSCTRPTAAGINRAWGLALRKRFCRKFNFELQAAATEDNIVSRSPRRTASSSPRSSRYLHSELGARRADPGGARFADVQHALALGAPACRSRCRASAAAARCRRSSRACRPRT